MKQSKVSTKDVINHYQRLYKALMPDADSVGLARDIWVDWEKSGITPPNVDEIAINHTKHENGFFYDIVKVAEKLEGKKLAIHYCAFCLDHYNFYAFSADDGYIVLVDDIFFQLLFFLCNILIFDAQGLIKEEEKQEVQQLAQEIIRNNYFNRRRFDFSQDQIIPRLLKRDYELAEFANYFFHALKAFIVSHEVGHHVLGHTTGKMKRIFSMQDKTQEIEVDKRKIEDEFEADKYGYKLFNTLSNTVDDTIYYAYCKYKFDFAPLFLFDLFDKLDRMSELKTSKTITYRTHPSPERRIEALKKNYDIDFSDPLYLGLKDSLRLVSI